MPTKKLNRGKPRRKQKDSKSQNHVAVNSKNTIVTTLSPANPVTNLGSISTSTTGIWSTDQSVASLSDMFRLFKVRKVTFEFAPLTTAGTALSQVPAGQLYFKTEGTSAPTTLADIETPAVSNVTTSWTSLLTIAAETILKEAKAYLTLREKDMPILQGPSGPGEQGYLATQDDGTQTTYGTLFWNFLNTATASTLGYYLRSTYGLDFKYILDPSSVSAKKHDGIRTNLGYHLHQQSSGCSHIEFGDGVLSKLTMTWMKAPSLIRQSLPPSLPNCDGSVGGGELSLKRSKVSQATSQDTGCSGKDDQITVLLLKIDLELRNLSDRIGVLERVE